MKDTVITAALKKKELRAALVCLGLAFLMNLGCILYYKTPFTELFSQLGYVFAIALALYGAWIIIRLIFRLFRKW